MAETYSIKLHDEAEKHLARQDRPRREKILANLDALKTNPRLPGVEPIVGHSGVFRLRVGSLRIVFRVDDVTRSVFIEGIAPRGQAYKPARLERL